MKFLIISPFPPLRGGISKETETLYDYLKTTNEIHVINFKRLYPPFLFPGKSQYVEQNMLKNNNNKIVSLLDSINPITWQKAADYITKNKFSTIIVRYWHPFFIPMYLYIFKQIRNSNVKIHCIADNIFPHDYFPFSKLLVKTFFSKIDKCFVMSDNTFNQLATYFKKNNIKKVFLPIKNNFGPLLDKDESKIKLGLSSEFTLLFFGLIRSYKGLDVLLKSVGKLKENDVKCKLLIVGECYENKNKYLNIIANMKLENYIMWIDKYIPDQDINLYFSASDLVVLPYIKASQSGIIPIAYNYNKPVLISNIDGLTEFVENNKTGYIFKSEDINSLSVKIETIINTKNKDFESYIINYKKKYTVSKLSDDIVSIIDYE